MTQCGSVLSAVLVLIAVVVIALVFVLGFAGNRRESARRLSDQKQQGIDLEEQIILLRTNIRKDFVSSTSPDLSGDTQGTSLTVSFPADTQSFPLFPVDVKNQLTQLTGLSAESDVNDPLLNAWVLSTSVDVSGTIPGTVFPSGRSADKNVQLEAVDAPKIVVRQLPASQFTLFSVAGSVEIDPKVFVDPGLQDGTIGRTYTGGELTLTGSVTTAYPVLAAGGFNTGGFSLTYDPGDGSSGATLNQGSTTANGNADPSSLFYSQARTSLNSKFLTNDLIPVDIVPHESIYDSSGNLKMDVFKSACTTQVIASAFEASDGSVQYQVFINGALEANQSNGPYKAVQGVLTFDYGEFPLAGSQTIYLEIRDTSGNPDSNGVIKILNAATLNGDLSIVSPNEIQVAGNFNVNGPTAASLITARDVKSVDDN